MEIEVLGPVRVHVDGQPIMVQRRQLRLLLALLAVHVGEFVSIDRITHVLWDVEPPRTFQNQIQVLARGLRGLAADGRSADPLETKQGEGYRLCAPPAVVDLQRFRCGCNVADDLLAAGRLAEADAALATALQLWRGPALQGLGGRFAEDESARLDECRLNATLRRVDIRLALGDYPDLVPDLTGLVQVHRLNDGLRSRLMVALYGCDRAGDGLAIYREGRQLLSEELGMEPSERMSAVHQAILHQRPVSHLVAELTGIRAVAKLSGPSSSVSATSLPPPRQLPPDLATFTGRTAVLGQLDALLSEHDGAGGNATPVIAVVGTAGVGKTALAVRWAHQVAYRFPDGQLYLNLRGYDAAPPVEPAQALLTFLRALGVTPERMPVDLDDAINRYRSLTADQRMLVVLDNACTADQVRPLLPGGPGCLVIVTSRDRLAGLRIRDGAQSITVRRMLFSEAHALLERVINAQRLQAQPDATARLIDLCAGLPLALRIAAEAVVSHPQLTIADLATELASSHTGLQTLATADDEPTTTVRSVFSWSLRSLPAPAAGLFRLLGLPRAPDISAAAAAALAGTTVAVARRQLTLLASAHLLEPTGRDRYQLHDLLRRYAEETAATQESEADRTAAVRRLLTWYLFTTDEADRLLLPRRMHTPFSTDNDLPTPEPVSRTHAEALRWTETEHANLVATVEQAAEVGAWDVAWQLPAAMWGHLYLRKPWADWTATYRLGLRAAQRLGDDYAQAWLLNGLGVAHWGQHRFVQARRYYHRALTHWRRLRHPWGAAMTLNNLGATCCGMRRYDEAIEHFWQALAIRIELDDRHGKAQTLTNLGEAHRETGNFVEAMRHSQSALNLFRGIDKQFGEANALHNLASAHYGLAQFAEAIALYQRSLALRETLGDRHGQGETLFWLGEAFHAAGQHTQARVEWQRALAIFEDLADPHAATVHDRLYGLDR